MLERTRATGGMQKLSTQSRRSARDNNPIDGKQSWAALAHGDYRRESCPECKEAPDRSAEDDPAQKDETARPRMRTFAILLMPSRTPLEFQSASPLSEEDLNGEVKGLTITKHVVYYFRQMACDCQANSV